MQETTREVRTLGLVGVGVIGAGWAARALHCGVDVVACDVDRATEERLRGAVENAAPALDALTAGMSTPPRGALRFTTEMAEMAARADFIQESVPEVRDLKRKVYAELTALAPDDVIVSSSTSGFMPSELQQGVTHPQRVLVGHPFNPVYLCPLVEIVGGERTCKRTRDAARDFYQSLGMHALVVRRETPGHLSDRLQEAMWREILHALNDDIATTAELDDAIVYGPGLRWAVMGMNQLYMIAGGAGGARRFIEQFGPALKWPWSHLEAPELSESIIDRFVTGTAEQAGGRSVRELERIRDECMVAVQRVLKRHDVASGAALNRFEAALARRAAANR